MKTQIGEKNIYKLKTITYKTKLSTNTSFNCLKQSIISPNNTPVWQFLQLILSHIRNILSKLHFFLHNLSVFI